MGKLEFDYLDINADEVQSIRDNFEDINGGGKLFVSKEEFSHQETDLEFDYKYVIEVIDLEEYTGEEGATITLELVVSPKNIHEDTIEDVKDTFCLEEGVHTLGHTELQQYGLGVVMAFEEYESFNIEQVSSKLDVLGTLLPVIDSLRGFKLDNAVNRVGETGWDSLRQAISNERYSI